MTSRPNAKESSELKTPQPVDFEQSNVSGPESQLLHGTHETFARSLSGGLSQLLQVETQVSLSGIRLTTVEDFQDALPNPTCLIKARLHPGFERMVLRFDCGVVLNLIDLMLGGTASTAPEARELTEIEWSLLEEISRIVMRHLSEAWESIRPVEFVVETSASNSSQLSYPYPSASAQRISFSASFAGQTGDFELVVPCSFFEVPAAAGDLLPAETASLSFEAERNARILEDAKVEIEVYLDSVKLKFKELLALREGQIVKLDHELAAPAFGSINGDHTYKGHVVSAGRKRAFQIEEVTA